ncbi:Alpha-(1,3)-fucosyltransferase C [Schistosoma japonicum]|nr:Alpha-(1,3)-fucosyltransferase C [Schistosoma japonicum]
MNMLESVSTNRHKVKYSFKLKVICSVLIIVTVIWSTRMFLLRIDSRVDFASILQNIYSPIIRSPVQKYSKKFSLEEDRIVRIYDSLSVNFSISYRLDSTIYSPYSSYQPYAKHDGPETRYLLHSENFAVGKSKKVAWFVSKCAPKSPRMQYANELSQYISVDIYGQCGTLTCPKNASTDTSTPECLKTIRENYKFYLSFENSLCSEYITEKLYRNALNNDILPIVMGASIEEYERVTPPYSFIHVDQFESPAKLAEYLKYLDNNDTAYNEYFAWHGHGVVHDWGSQPQCAMCLLAHTSDLFGPYWVPNVARWWNTGCDGRKLRWTP